eukprot:2001984-Rhodomonas_salina.2
MPNLGSVGAVGDGRLPCAIATPAVASAGAVAAGAVAAGSAGSSKDDVVPGGVGVDDLYDVPEHARMVWVTQSGACAVLAWLPFAVMFPFTGERCILPIVMAVSMISPVVSMYNVLLCSERLAQHDAADSDMRRVCQTFQHLGIPFFLAGVSGSVWVVVAGGFLVMWPVFLVWDVKTVGGRPPALTLLGGYALVLGVMATQGVAVSVLIGVGAVCVGALCVTFDVAPLRGWGRVCAHVCVAVFVYACCEGAVQRCV